ncbi:hypothetical protein JCM31826_21710 [Thermaurantimonas aggregans]|uniref:Uncharacterized protein n=1 Tax=Thermaurantimonas aggregans TaxID=2173829 RepID=A0A401XNV0_9FLAO|nr:hypothetical protein [Thermaurantimonas aggregans]MCX8149274.1 hypothetical protein [Thermaurantimonas aggregans]GCD78689.1 hypothetical protein JCM31826_21710 [Thermaurantimonas aggregans]
MNEIIRRAMKVPGILIAVIILFSSCLKDKFDFDSFKDIELSPEIWVPFGEVSLRLSDLSRDTSLISIDQDGFITIVLKKDSILKTTLSKALLFPDQDTVPLAAVTGQQTTADVAISLFNDAEVKKIYFDTLEISWSIPSSVPQGVEMSLQFTQSQHEIGPLTLQVNNINNAPGVYHKSNFYNGILDLSKGNTTHNTLQLIISALQYPSSIPAGTPIPCFINITKLKVKGMEGYIGNSQIELPVVNSILNLKGLEKFREGITFSNPKLDLSIYNNTGLEIGFEPIISGATATGNVTVLQMPNITISKAPNPGLFSTTQVQLNNSNSNLAEMLKKLPEFLIISGSIELNPNGKQNNFLFNNEEIIVNGLFEIPLEFSAKDMYFEKEISNFKFWNSSSTNLPEFIEFEFTSENGFPFELSVSAIFLDSITNSVIRIYDIDVLKPATVNTSGRVISPNTYRSTLRINESDLTALNAAKSFYLRVKINTPDNGNQSVKIYDSYYFKTRLAAKAKLKFKPVK